MAKSEPKPKTKPTKAQKDRARRSARRAKKVRKYALLASPAIGLIPPHVPGLFAPAAVSFVFDSRVESCEALADDPPKADYQEPSQVREPTLQLSALSDPLGEAAIPLISAVDASARLIEAMVVAIERAQGAELANDWSAAALRANEAYSWAAQASAQFIASSEATPAFTDALNEYRPATNEHPFRLRALAAARPARLLPISDLEVMGFQRTLSPALLPLNVNAAQPVPDLITALLDSAANDRDYGQFLQGSVEQRLLLEGEFALA
jgi:hypothetical protein